MLPCESPQLLSFTAEDFNPSVVIKCCAFPRYAVSDYFRQFTLCGSYGIIPLHSYEFDISLLLVNISIYRTILQLTPLPYSSQYEEESAGGSVEGSPVIVTDRMKDLRENLSRLINMLNNPGEISKYLLILSTAGLP